MSDDNNIGYAKIGDGDFELFKKEFQYWVDKFGLYMWEVVFLFTENEKPSSSASLSPDIEGMVCVAALEKWQSKLSLSNKAIARDAFHEVCEMFLCNLRAYAQLDIGETTKREVGQEVHRIIRTMENVIFEPDWNNRQKESKNEVHRKRKKLSSK